MKSIVSRMFLLLIIGIGGLFAYSYYYQGVVDLEASQEFVSFVEIEREAPVEGFMQEEYIMSYADETPVVEEGFIYEIFEEDVSAPIIEEVIAVEEVLAEEIIEEVEVEVVEAVVEEVEVIVEAPVKAKKLSIVLGDISDENIDSVIKYLGDNKYVGLAFSYGSLDAMKKARDAGFTEIVASVTMEPFDESIWLPVSTIKTSNSADLNKEILNTVLNETHMPIAIVNKMGSKITSVKHMDTLRPIMEEIKSKNIGFIDSKSNFHSVAVDVAEEYGVPYVANYTFIDKDISTETVVFDNLDKLKERADVQDYVLGMGDYSARLVKVLDTWLTAVEKDAGYEIVPVSVLMK
jgi:polysaccharide deacetylase 2 family uncharacterized protein YibQ